MRRLDGQEMGLGVEHRARTRTAGTAHLLKSRVRNRNASTAERRSSAEANKGSRCRCLCTDAVVENAGWEDRVR